MRQRAAKVVLWVVMGLILSGCQGKPLPGGMEEGELLARGREAAYMLASGGYEEVYNLLREDVAAGTSVEEIKEMVLRQTEGAGEYRQINSTMVTGQSSEGEEYGVAVIYCDYSKKDVLYRLAYDTEYELIGMQVKRQ